MNYDEDDDEQNTPKTLPGSAREDRLIETGQTAIVAIMAAILKAGDIGKENIYTLPDCVELARSLYKEAIHQANQEGSF